MTSIIASLKALLTMTSLWLLCPVPDPRPDRSVHLVKAGETVIGLDGVEVSTPSRWAQGDVDTVEITIERVAPDQVPAPFELAQFEKQVTSFYQVRASRYISSAVDENFHIRIPVQEKVQGKINPSRMTCDWPGNGWGPDEACGWTGLPDQETGKFVDFVVRHVRTVDPPILAATDTGTPVP